MPKPPQRVGNLLYTRLYSRRRPLAARSHTQHPWSTWISPRLFLPFPFLPLPPSELPSPRPVRRLSFGPSFLFFLDGPLPRSPNPSPPLGPHEICPRGHEPRRGRDFSRAASGSSRRAVFIGDRCADFNAAPTVAIPWLFNINGTNVSCTKIY